MKRLALILALMAAPVSAADLTIPGAQVTKTDTSPAGSTRLPNVPWNNGMQTPGTEGAIRRTVFGLANSTFTSLQLIEPLREQLLSDGYTQTFTCADAECGGFDFRFQLDLIGEPFMHVDLGNYRYLLMEKPGASPHTVALLSSPGRDTGYVHVTEVSDAVFPELTVETPTTALPDTTSQDLVDQLVTNGHAVLPDLIFETGSVDLGPGPFQSLENLAAWLQANPTARVILVGHTDAVGSLESNTSLSQRRAAAVSSRLIEAYNTNPLQLDAAGAGYLAPLTTNLTEEGRAANRRVEVVLLSRD